MAKEAAPANAPAAPAAETPKDSFSLKKILMIGIPIVLVQIVLIYFVFVKFIAPSMAGGQQHAAPEAEPAADVKEEAAQVLVIKDLIINPAGTNGTRFLLTTVGLEVPTAEIKAELEQKEIQTRDILNSVLTSKGLEELTIPQFKETLRKEILEKVNANLRTGKVRNVYFSKFIIQ
ncbi:MAG: flagellar basal body-associated FliL family protein [Bacteroidetes bacterium]|nr:flagellar basal body-associated FliL family protein [Bacteroidota bacterium]